MKGDRSHDNITYAPVNRDSHYKTGSDQERSASNRTDPLTDSATVNLELRRHSCIIAATACGRTLASRRLQPRAKLRSNPWM